MGVDLHYQVPHRGSMSEWDYLLFLFETFLIIRDGAPAVPGINGGRPFEGLDPALHVTLELSNEIWNPGFPVHLWMLDQSLINGLTVHEQIAGQIELVFDIAEGVFMGDPRLKKYIGGTLNNSGYLQQVVDALRPGLHIDAVGPAAYFGPHPSVMDLWIGDADTVTGECPSCPTADEILVAARAEIPSLRPGLEAHRTLADTYINPDGSSPRLVLYEAGQSFKSLFQPWAPQANLAQSKSAMYDAYTNDLIPLLVEEGVDEILWYSFMTNQTPDVLVPYGIWNDMNQLITSPVPEKLRARRRAEGRGYLSRPAPPAQLSAGAILFPHGVGQPPVPDHNITEPGQDTPGRGRPRPYGTPSRLRVFFHRPGFDRVDGGSNTPDSWPRFVQPSPGRLPLRDGQYCHSKRSTALRNASSPCRLLTLAGVKPSLSPTPGTWFSVADRRRSAQEVSSLDRVGPCSGRADNLVGI